MNEYWIGILGGLIGSTLTVIVTKILEIIVKSKEHQYMLEREFFVKKLAAAEATMTQYTILSNALSSISVLFDRLSHQEHSNDDYLQNNLLQQSQHQMDIANNASFIVANSITLYFDLITEFNKNEIIRSFYNLLGSIEPLSNNIEIARKNYIEKKGTKDESDALSLFSKSEKDLKNLLQKISLSYLEFSDELQKVMIQIRNEMRKFEY